MCITANMYNKHIMKSTLIYLNLINFGYFLLSLLTSRYEIKRNFAFYFA